MCDERLGPRPEPCAENGRHGLVVLPDWRRFVLQFVKPVGTRKSATRKGPKIGNPRQYTAIRPQGINPWSPVPTPLGPDYGKGNPPGQPPPPGPPPRPRRGSRVLQSPASSIILPAPPRLEFHRRLRRRRRRHRRRSVGRRRRSVGLLAGQSVGRPVVVVVGRRRPGYTYSTF